MEFSFKLYHFLEQLEANPQYMVLWASFGVPLLMLGLALPAFIARKSRLEKYSKPFFSILYISLIVSWLTGFVVMMIFLFTGVSGIRMFIVWILLFITYFIFTIFNHNQIDRWLKQLTESKSKK
jgi:hypothetical protein